MKNLITITMIMFVTCCVSIVINFEATGAEQFTSLQEFQATIDGKPMTMEYDKEGVFIVNNGVLSIKGFGHLWTHDMTYDLTHGGKVVVETEVRLQLAASKDKEGSNIKIAFSSNRQGWKGMGGDSDALTFHIGCDKNDPFYTAVRTGMYKKYLTTTKNLISPNHWETLKVELTSTQLIAYVGDTKTVDIDVSEADFPRKGYVGLLSFERAQPATEIKYLRISSDFSGNSRSPLPTQAVAPNGYGVPCGPYYVIYPAGPDKNTSAMDFYEMRFDIRDVIDDYDFVFFTEKRASLDTNQDGFSDKDFVEKNDQYIIWRPSEGSRKITQQGCCFTGEGCGGFNENCAYGIIRIQAKPGIDSGSAEIPMTAIMKCPNSGDDCSTHNSLKLSYTGCASQTPSQNVSKPITRLALVIGNANYQRQPLSNPVNDARAIATVLQRLGFEVITVENVSQRDMKRAIDEFGQKLSNYDIGLFYYSGHGAQVNGENYLIPVDANPQSQNDVEADCVKAEKVLGKMEDAGTTTNIVILDACRDNPFEKSWTKSLTNKGLAAMNAPVGALIAYATSPGNVAFDDSQRSNSLYTWALLQHIETPNITILDMFQRVRKTLVQETQNAQVPWESTSLTGSFYFKMGK